MKVSMVLLIKGRYGNKIAPWYYNEWRYIAPDITLDRVNKNVLETSRSRKKFPLAFILHENQNLLGAIALKFRENKNYPEYEHWLGAFLLIQSIGEKGIPVH